MKMTRVVGAAALLLIVKGGVAADAGKSGGMEGHGQMMGDRDAMEMPMSKHHRAMMARMDSLDGVLTAKLDAVRQADSEKEKLRALEAAVTELVSQRRAMHAAMPKMMGRMMQHMMQHMGAGMMAESGRMLADCPMMQGSGHEGTTGSKDEADGGGHQGHH